MKTYLLFLCTAFSLTSIAQDPIAVANKCYTDKNYDCASEQYKKVISENKHKPEDRSLILYRIGYSLGQLKRNEEAIRYLKDAITAKSDYSDAYWTLAWVYKVNMEQHALATENYTKAISYLPSDSKSLKSLYYSRGDSYYSLKKDSLALQDFIAYIKLDSTSGNTYIGAANAAYNLRKYKDATTWYEKAIVYGDTSKTVMAARYYLLGQALYKQYKYEESLVPYRKSLETLPSYAGSQWAIGAVYYNQKKWQDAIREYGKAKPLYAGDTASLKQLHYLIGKSHSGLKDYNKAIQELDAAIKINPNYGTAVWEKASILYKQKKYKEAAVAYSKAIELYNDELDLVDLYLYRGNCYLKLKDTANAKIDFTEALDSDYSDMAANTQMGNINFAQKKYLDARTNFSYGISNYDADSAELSRIYFRKGFSNIQSGTNYIYTGKDALYQSIKYDSTNKEAHRYLADVYYMQSYFSLAEQELDKCILLYKNVKDSLPNIYIYRALARWQQKKYKDALADYEQSDKLKKFILADYIKSMGQLAFEIKDYTKASALFTRLIPMYKPEQKTELVFAYFARGRSSLELNKKDPAIADLNKALELSPGNADVKTWLDKAKAL